MFDLVHVVPSDDKTTVVKRYPKPSTPYHDAHRNGFGNKTKHHGVLKIKSCGVDRYFGVLELPDFGSGIHVSCKRYGNSLTIMEGSQLYGAGHTGWWSR